MPAPHAVAPLADVFLSYSHTDRDVARNLAATLRDEGFDVWFDEHIYAGATWEALLMGVIGKAKAVIVLWSARSLASEWVRKEALIALQTHRLVPVAIEDCILPPPFDTSQTALMPGWTGGDHPELERLLTGLSRLAPPSRIDNVRPGFDTNFLDTEIALPGITGVAEEFRYLHFSVVMNPARRLAWYVAANMARYAGPPVERGGGWLADPMLPISFQPQNSHFLGTGLDRGHIARVRSVSWGTQREAQLANRQAFFWTNTAPQHPHMNQRWWLAVERWEEALVEARERAIGFSGPLLQDEDPVHGASEQTIGRLRVRENFRLPRCFWKVVLVKGSQERLESAAFWLDQNALLAASGGGAVDAQSFRTSVEEIERRTGLDFGNAVRKARQIRPP